MTRNHFALLFCACLSLLFTKTASADIVISSLGATTTIDFESTLVNSNNGTFAGAGFTPGATSAGQLDSNSWSIAGFGTSVNFGGTGTSGDPARGSSGGGVGTGGIYAFDASADGGSIGIGIQPGGSDFTPGDITLRLLNSTGSTVTSFDIAYDVAQYNDQNRANSLNFEYSFDDTTYIAVSSLDFTSDGAEDLTPNWEINARSATISGISLADGANLYFRWVGDDVTGSGARDEFQIDNIDITFDTASIPEPTTLGVVAGLAGLAYIRRRKGKSEQSETEAE